MSTSSNARFSPSCQSMSFRRVEDLQPSWGPPGRLCFWKASGKLLGTFRKILGLFPQTFQRSRGTYSFVVFHKAHSYELYFSFLLIKLLGRFWKASSSFWGSRHIHFDSIRWFSSVFLESFRGRFQEASRSFLESRHIHFDSICGFYSFFGKLSGKLPGSFQELLGTL